MERGDVLVQFIRVVVAATVELVPCPETRTPTSARGVRPRSSNPPVSPGLRGKAARERSPPTAQVHTSGASATINGTGV
jgi:hypothetical protein